MNLTYSTWRKRIELCSILNIVMKFMKYSILGGIHLYKIVFAHTKFCKAPILLHNFQHGFELDTWPQNCSKHVFGVSIRQNLMWNSMAISGLSDAHLTVRNPYKLMLFAASFFLFRAPNNAVVVNQFLCWFCRIIQFLFDVPKIHNFHKFL